MIDTQTKLNSQAIRDGWVELLAREQWDCFATLTFNKPWRNENHAAGAFRAWLFQWCEQQAVERGLCKLLPLCKGRPRRSGWWWNQWRKGSARPVYVVGVEPHQSGNLHLHAVIRHSLSLPDLNRREGWKLWKNCHGICRIEPPRSNDDVSSYLSKYVVKDGDLFISESFQSCTVLKVKDDHSLLFPLNLGQPGLRAGPQNR